MNQTDLEKALGFGIRYTNAEIGRVIFVSYSTTGVRIERATRPATPAEIKMWQLLTERLVK